MERRRKSEVRQLKNFSTKSAKLLGATLLAALVLTVSAPQKEAEAGILGGALGGALFGGLIGGRGGMIGGAIMGGIIGGAARASRRNRYYYNRNPGYRRHMNRRHNSYRAAPGYSGRGGANARKAQARRRKTYGR
jgi:hypothetical protein